VTAARARVLILDQDPDLLTRHSTLLRRRESGANAVQALGEDAGEPAEKAALRIRRLPATRWC
jgi:hypothetical protein